MALCPLAKPLRARHDRLRLALEARRLSWVLVTNPSNIYYLTGFRGSAGLALFGPGQASLWVDPRYTLQAEEQAGGVRVCEVRGSLLKAVARWLRRNRVGRLGYEDRHLTCVGLQELRNELGSTVRLQAAGELVEELRLVKDETEIEHIRGAALLTVAVFEQVLSVVKPGVRESDLAAEIEYRIRREGADGPAFETIVASGPRAALPHARASAKSLKKGELVIVDLGAILCGYAADMTRTLCLGRPSRRVRQLYDSVREAQQQGVNALRAGIQAARVDSVARRVLRERGLARYFTHGTGHGVGIDIHERPRLARGVTTRLEVGCVVTVEPGVYLEGFGGIRIEDTVLVRKEGPDVLTPVPKENWIID